MNIGIVTTWFERGAAYVSRQYADLLSKHHDVFIFARGGEEYAGEDPEWQRYPVYWDRRRNYGVGTYLDIPAMRRWIGENHIEIVLFNEQQWWAPVVEADKLGVITGAYVDYYTEDSIGLFWNYDFLLCNTKRHFSAFRDHPGAHYVPWGTDIDLFVPKSRESTDRVVFFHSAGMNPLRKGTDLVLRAAHALQAPFKLIIHAQVSLKGFFPELAPLIEALLDDRKLEVVHETVGAPGLYSRGDVYVYPTRLEGIGLTIAEAYACGLPVIVPDAAPMNEFVYDKHAPRSLLKVDRYVARSDGYYWPQNIVSIEDLTQKMRWFVENGSEIVQMRIEARNHAVNTLNWMDRDQTLLRVVNTARHSQDKAQYREKANIYDNKRFPLFRQLRSLYRLRETLRKPLKKLVQRIGY